jgi:hypothetical protein
MNDPVLSHVSRASIFQREATWRPRHFEPGAIPQDVLPDANPRDNS